ncbi:hypothetical protein [Caudoviricetes sp.]|nr:hypothetical protein [Caudoviricetes sp.]
MIKVKYADFVYYNQNDNTNKISFSFLKKVGHDEYKELMYPTKCRDILASNLIFNCNDVYTYEVYGHKCNLSLYEDNLLLRVIKERYACEDKEEEKIIERILHNLDERLGFEKAKVVKENNYNSFIVTADRRWQESTLLFSIYTLAIRLALLKDLPEDIESFEDLLKKTADIYYNTDSERSSVILHNINIDLLLNNIKDIVKDDPITGLCDKELLYFKSNNNIDYCSYAFYIRNKRISVCKSLLVGYTGIFALSSELQRCSKSSSACLSWIKNYKKHVRMAKLRETLKKKKLKKEKGTGSIILSEPVSPFPSFTPSVSNSMNIYFNENLQ